MLLKRDKGFFICLTSKNYLQAVSIWFNIKLNDFNFFIIISESAY